MMNDASRNKAGTKAAKTRAEKYAKATPEEKTRIDETRHQAAIKANEERISLEYYVKKFKKNRQCFDPVRKSVDEIEEIRKNFVTEFSKEKIEKMTLQQYVAGYKDPKTGTKKEDSFSSKISIPGPFGSLENPSGMFTFEIFIRAETQEPDYDKTKYSSTEDAFESTKNSILKLLEAGEKCNIESINKIDLHSLLKSKILSIYFADKFLNIHSKTAIVQIASDLELGSEKDLKKKSLFQIQQLLLNYKNEKEFLKDLYIIDYGHILWRFYDKGNPSRRKQIKSISYYLDELSKYSISTTHIQVLKKFYKTSGKYISLSKIYGSRDKEKGGKKFPVEPDELVVEPHYMHNLVKGVYKPKNDDYAQSIMLNPKSKWELEIDRESPTLNINYDFGEYDKYKEQIEPLKKCYEDGIPIGILFRTVKGRYKCLGLGVITSQTNARFVIESFGISDEDSSTLKNETISEFENSLQDPELTKINDISYGDFLDTVDFQTEFRLDTLNPDSSPKTWPAKISQIIDNCESGNWSLPDFQRYFDWDKEMIRKFLLSIFSGFYVGSLLLWMVKNNDEHNKLGKMAIEGVSIRKEDLKTNEIILDGQQRITSLYYAIKSPDFSLSKEFTSQRMMIMLKA